jgi:hypothetical protein
MGAVVMPVDRLKKKKDGTIAYKDECQGVGLNPPEAATVSVTVRWSWWGERPPHSASPLPLTPTCATRTQRSLDTRNDRGPRSNGRRRGINGVADTT